MIKIIAAVSLNNVIGQNNDIPWNGRFPADMKFFRTSTANSTIIMGRKTFESIGSKPLPKRRNIVLTSQSLTAPGIELFNSLGNALTTCTGDVWVIGGAGVYKEAMAVADELYITTIPETITGDGLIYFPEIDTNVFKQSDKIILDKELYVVKYIK